MELLHNDIETVKSSLIENAYPPLLIDKVIKKYFAFKFSSNQSQLKDKSVLITLNYTILKFHTISKINFQENFNIKLVFN